VAVALVLHAEPGGGVPDTDQIVLGYALLGAAALLLAVVAAWTVGIVATAHRRLAGVAEPPTAPGATPGPAR